VPLWRTLGPPCKRWPVPNGVGPWWFPRHIRAALTSLSSVFFVTASWDRHDQGYARACPSRAECDRKFLAAMLTDAGQAGPVWRMAGCTVLAWWFWVMVRLFGWASYGAKE